MPDGTRSNGPGYDEDFYAWTQYQADVLRSMPCDDNRFDRENVAEEIEDLGKSERHTVESQITRVLEHFLKLAQSPADRPRYGWMRSIAEARQVLRQKMTATLRRHASDAFAELYEDAREAARLSLLEHGEEQEAAALPTVCPYTLDQVLDRNWYPEPPRSGSAEEVP
jgi:Mg/Co/Ni transporter MgtE